jgi:farnesyl-diphosphate farnesyltransferase
LTTTPPAPRAEAGGAAGAERPLGEHASPVEAKLYEAPTADDLAFQERILKGVSRSFALTIPQLPGRLRREVANAYLLCRIIDTIEDDPAFNADATDRWLGIFLDVVRTGRGAHAFAAELEPQLSPATPADERRLIRECDRVIRITQSLSNTARVAIQRCLTTMSRGMGEFVREGGPDGLPTLAHLERYCYFVAGVVGEMLTDLFCDYSADIAARRDDLERRARAFGQGLQLTNILKDMREDHSRGICWLPRDLFHAHGVDLARLGDADRGPQAGYEAAVRRLVQIAHADLRDALEYTLAIPGREVGIRRFLLWSVLLAARTLDNIHRTPGFVSSQEVKVSRPTVAAITAVPGFVVGSDVGVAALFAAATRRPSREAEHTRR